MFGYILKFVLLILATMIGLNIFAPQRVETILSQVSESTDIKEDTLQSGLDKMTHFTQDTVDEIITKVQKNFSKEE